MYIIIHSHREKAEVVVERREEGNVLRRMVDAQVPGQIQRRRRKIWWIESCKRDVETVGLNMGDVLDRKRYSKPFRRPQMMGKFREKEQEDPCTIYLTFYYLTFLY